MGAIESRKLLASETPVGQFIPYWGQNKSCSKSYAKTERSGNVMQRGGFFQEVAMA